MARRSTGPGEATKHAPVSHVALMRGINVGGKNKISMTDLASVFADAGCGNVRTYIQSGNVLFNAPARAAAGVPERVSVLIAKKFGFASPVVLRTAAEMRASAKVHLAATARSDPKSLYVGFLKDEPARGLVGGLDPERSPGDAYKVRGREIYMVLGNGAAKTKLTTAYFDSALKTVSTFRNWQTVGVLAGLAAGPGQRAHCVALKGNR